MSKKARSRTLQSLAAGAAFAGLAAAATPAAADKIFVTNERDHTMTVLDSASKVQARR